MTVYPVVYLTILCSLHLLQRCNGFAPPRFTFHKGAKLSSTTYPKRHPSVQQRGFGELLLRNRREPLKDILGLGFPEIALALVAALVLFGPETMKSLSKDVGKAAAELKDIPKTFKEGMEEGAESVEVSKMKAIAAEKRKKRDEKLAAKKDEEEDDDEEDDEEEDDEK